MTSFLPLGTQAVNSLFQRGLSSSNAAAKSKDPEPVPISKLYDNFLDGTSSTYLEELERRYQTDPNSVDKTWASFFSMASTCPALPCAPDRTFHTRCYAALTLVFWLQIEASSQIRSRNRFIAFSPGRALPLSFHPSRLLLFQTRLFKSLCVCCCSFVRIRCAQTASTGDNNLHLRRIASTL